MRTVVTGGAMCHSECSRRATLGHVPITVPRHERVTSFHEEVRQHRTL